MLIDLLEIILWLCIFLFSFNYFIYPLIIIILSKTFIDKHQDNIDDLYMLPKVSLIIAAFNEEKVIRAKIENSLKLSYPKDRLEIIVVSDGSDDETPNIARSYSKSNVISLHDNKRNGKSAALNRGVEISTGEIIVFSDANNDFSVNAITKLVQHFSDETVGAVTGAKHIYDGDDRESTMGDGLYWKYESAIKKAESALGSITSGDGEIFAVRKLLFRPINTNLINDDAAITFDIVKSGYRVLYEPEAGSYEDASIDLIDDFYVKVRMTAGGYQTIRHEFNYLFPPTSMFAIKFILHKVLRWLAPHFLITIFMVSLLLSSNTFYLLLFLVQIIFYSIALYGWTIRKANKLPSYIYIPMYFTLMNSALFFGFLRHLKGKQKVQWRKAER